MTDRHPAARVGQPGLLRLLSATGYAGCLALVVGTLVAQMLVPDYNWVADTISDLAAGRWEIVMDIALYGFAAGTMATSLAAANAHPGGADWSLGVLSLALAAAIVVVVGARNEYGDMDDAGVTIHSYLVYGLGLAFLAAPLSMARAMRGDVAWARPALLGTAAAWGVLAPVFLLSPTGIDGLLERLLGLVACTMISIICTALGVQTRAN